MNILKEAALRLKEEIEARRFGRQARLTRERIYNDKPRRITTTTTPKMESSDEQHRKRR